MPRAGIWRAFVTVAAVVGALSAVSATPAAAATGPYEIINFNSGKCVDVSGISKSDGANVHQWTCRHQSNQMWSVVPDWYTDGYFLLVVQHSGKCLDVSGPSTADGANVHQWTCHNGFNQQWSLTGGPGGGAPVPGNTVYRFVNRYSGKCLEVAGGSLSEGANIRQWTCNGSYHQYWVVSY
jgi:glucosylceramidase